MPAEAFASIDIAWIFSAIFLRSRSTFDRLPSASERLPPDFCWIAITMPKKFASGSGIRSYSRAQASPSGMPIAWVSMIALNSLRQRLRCVGGDHLDRIEQRQAGLDAAHDHVDRVGQSLQEIASRDASSGS